MKVKLLCSRSGVGFSQNVGDEIDVGDAEGLRMVNAGQAVEVGSSSSQLQAAEAEEADRIAAEVEAAKNKTEAETATKKVSTEKAVKNE